jgi:hypothetical protein
MGSNSELSAMLAVSERRQAALAALTPEQAAALERYYRKVDEEYKRRTVAKRAQGHGDCSRELAAAEREAATAIRMPRAPLTSTAAPRRVNGPSGRPRPQAARSSSRSGDSPDSDDGPPPPPLRAFDQERGLRHISHGVEKLLRKLAVGLDDQALQRAAQLVLVLDEDAAADREAVAR